MASDVHRTISILYWAVVCSTLDPSERKTLEPNSILDKSSFNVLRYSIEGFVDRSEKRYHASRRG
uniref:Uncharacterized protein n=1 Tax=Romanomermis culicivorax TaxID=13658 RepID=A0A915L183_ROMCU